MIRLVTFDLDDTLWDVRPALLRAEACQWDWLEAHFGDRVNRSDEPLHRTLKRELLQESPALKHHISAFRERFIERVLLEAGVPAEVASTAAAEAFAAFLAERHRVEAFPEAAPMLQILRRRFKLGALTNGNADVMKTPLGEYFDVVYRAEEVGASKPAPDLFAAAARAAGVEPGEMAHVGDHPEHDIEGARRFGARAIWFNPAGETSAMADASIACLSALPIVLEEMSSGPVA
ncbi:MAG: HAD-IA family hydrolase [Halieaceae bacterium]|jgi:putative hydrolase of the HAD superfamily|nr:HAD-IA family hydrolase [Halieaceae bacterium]